MRRLRVLTVIPLVAGLLFAGAATAAAQPGAPVIPGVPSLNLPYVDAGFPCEFPRFTDSFKVANTNDWPVTDDSFVFLMPQTVLGVPAQPGAVMGQGMDLSFMKCFFHYREGTVSGVPVTDWGFPCTYPTLDGVTPVTPTGGHPIVHHDFAHSMFVVRDTFAILLCWGTADEQPIP